LVPIFSDYARLDDHDELWKLLGFLLTLLTLVLGVVVLGVMLAAPSSRKLLGKGLDPQYLALAAQMIRVTAPASVFPQRRRTAFSELYALQRFTLPAFNAAIYNATLVIVIVVFGRLLDTSALAWGLLAASIVQVAFQWLDCAARACACGRLFPCIRPC
jgi:putative peptidoglycan lipid II flippase